MNSLNNLGHTIRDMRFETGFLALVMVVLALGICERTTLFAIGLMASYLGSFEHSTNPTDL